MMTGILAYFIGFASGWLWHSILSDLDRDFDK